MHELFLWRNFWASFITGTPLPDKGRIQHSCAHIRHKNGSDYVIVVGGYNSYNDFLKTSDILSFEPKASPSNLKWSPGIVKLYTVIPWLTRKSENQVLKWNSLYARQMKIVKKFLHFMEL